MKTGLNSPSFMASISRKSSSETCSDTCVQISMTLLYRSPLVIRPSKYSCSILMTSFRAASMISSFLDGMCKSSIPMETPARVAYRKPRSLRLSKSRTVSAFPKT